MGLRQRTSAKSPVTTVVMRICMTSTVYVAMHVLHKCNVVNLACTCMAIDTIAHKLHRIIILLCYKSAEIIKA